jgi:cell division protein FtsQ
LSPHGSRGKRDRPRATSARLSSGLPSSRARFDARAARVRRRPWFVAGWLAVVLALLAGGVWLVEFSPVLVTRSVKVEGVPPGDVSAIVERAAVRMGTPLARVDTRLISRRVSVTAALAQVTVSRSYPSTILIKVTLRVPVLAVKNPQGQVEVVDSEGVAFATVSAAPKGVPLIDAVESPPSMESLRAAMTVLRALSAAQRDQVTNVTVLGPNMVTFKLGTVTVAWGGASDPELKVKVMTDLLTQKGVGTIDVSAPHTPVIR